MSIMKNNYCVILAGGKGRRLWPTSRENLPKQFIDFFGTGRTQLQHAFDRMRKILPLEHIYISTNYLYSHIVREQLPELPDENILSEPIHRNTAPSVVWANHRVMSLNKDANLLVVPSDHAVLNENTFIENITTGFGFVAQHNCILSLGIKPTRPEPGYGYIQIGEEACVDGVYTVKSFIEKPEREFANMFLENGEFYWNTGFFLFNSKHFANCFNDIFPHVFEKFDKENPVFNVSAEYDFVVDNFSAFSNMSIDCGILEQCSNVFVMKCNFGWADLGTWHSLYEALSKMEGDNVVIDSDVIIDDSHGNVVKMPKGKLAVINGLDGYIVSDSDNVLLICKKSDSSSLIRKYVNKVKIKNGDDFI